LIPLSGTLQEYLESSPCPGFSHVTRHRSHRHLQRSGGVFRAKWHVRVSKQSCKQGNRLILWASEYQDIFFPRFFSIFF
jgi:TolB-like protein